jgi:hypothetical protein
MSRLAIRRKPASKVTPIRSGSVFQIGRPSGTSKIVLAARMNALT